MTSIPQLRAQSNLRATYGILFILLFGFLLRVFFLLQGLELPLDRDQLDYFTLAHSLQNDLLHYGEIFRPPLYPAFLAVLFQFSGDSRFGIGLTQALLDTCNIALIFAITRALFHKPRISVLAALFYALYPEAIELARLLLTETLYTFLSLLGVWVLVRRRDAPADVRLVLVGICFGLAALTREIMGYFALAVVPIWFWLTALPRWRHALAQTLFFLCGLIVILAPWVIRNWQIEQRFVLVSTSGEYNLVKDNLSLIENLDKADFERAQQQAGEIRLPRSDDEIMKLIARQSPDRRSGYAVRVALQIFAFDPLKWLAVKTGSVAGVWSASTRRTPFTQYDTLPTPIHQLLKPLASIYIITILLLATFGFIFAPARGPKLLFALVILYSIATFMLTHFQIRYRMPLASILIPYAAFAVSEWKAWFKPSPRLYAAFAVACLFLWLALEQT